MFTTLDFTAILEGKFTGELIIGKVTVKRGYGLTSFLAVVGRR